MVLYIISYRCDNCGYESIICECPSLAEFPCPSCNNMRDPEHNRKGGIMRIIEAWEQLNCPQCNGSGMIGGEKVK